MTCYTTRGEAGANTGRHTRKRALQAGGDRRLEHTQRHTQPHARKAACLPRGTSTSMLGSEAGLRLWRLHRGVPGPRASQCRRWATARRIHWYNNAWSHRKWRACSQYRVHAARTARQDLRRVHPARVTTWHLATVPSPCDSASREATPVHRKRPCLTSRGPVPLPPEVNSAHKLGDAALWVVWRLAWGGHLIIEFATFTVNVHGEVAAPTSHHPEVHKIAKLR